MATRKDSKSSGRGKTFGTASGTRKTSEGVSVDSFSQARIKEVRKNCKTKCLRLKFDIKQRLLTWAYKFILCSLFINWLQVVSFCKNINCGNLHLRGRSGQSLCSCQKRTPEEIENTFRVYGINLYKLRNTNGCLEEWDIPLCIRTPSPPLPLSSIDSDTLVVVSAPLKFVAT